LPRGGRRLGIGQFTGKLYGEKIEKKRKVTLIKPRKSKKTQRNVQSFGGGGGGWAIRVGGGVGVLG